MRILTLLLTVIFCVARVSGMTDEAVDNALHRLDGLLAEREHFNSERQDRIDSLCAQLEGSVSPALMMTIADAYAGFNNDSALSYLYRGESLAEGVDKLPFRWKAASLLPLSGFIDLAQYKFSTIPADSVPVAELASYYDAGRQMFSYTASTYADYPVEASRFRDSVLHYQSRLIEVLPDGGTESDFNRAELFFMSGSVQSAKVMFEEVIDNLPDDSNLRARAAHHLSAIAKAAGDQEAYIYYLALSATADVLSATREVLSLQELGSAVYEAGDVGRAHSYLSYALANAVECGAPLRMIDASRSLPIIEQAHMASINKSRQTINIILAVMSVLVIVMIATLLMLRKQMQRMTVLQGKLKAANTAKEVYISQFLQLCSIYMDKLNQFCKIATRKLAAGQTDELYRMTKSGKFVEEQSSEFYDVFDNAFLHIYPDFVDKVNSLLRPDSRIELKPGEQLNTDLRILAFMRLGIEESARIAQVLNYSLNTIYAYRNRLKARAVNKETFEHDIMNIDSTQ